MPGHGGDVIERYDLGPEGSFALEFIHSVALSPVRDIYRLTDGGFVQIAEIFEDHGAGLPSFAGDVGATGWRHEHGRFVLDMHRELGPIHLRVQPDYANRLFVDGREISLDRFAEPLLTLAPCTENPRDDRLENAHSRTGG